ncbi:hypothetical protein A28LD_1486 [Idiomarina sp. A28L]|nr:hypothetical protein A28LD_1486 [Idiomarina sp. A28L]
MWRSLVTLIVTLFAYIFIAFGYDSMESDKARVENFAQLEQLFDRYIINPEYQPTELTIQYVNLHDEYYTHSANTEYQRYSFTFNYPSDSRYASAREVFSYELPTSFQQTPIFSLTDAPTIYALSPPAQFDHEEEKATGLGFFIFIFVLIAFPWLVFVIWLWQGHNATAK